MDMGIVLVFFVMAALLLPPLWAVWWALDSIGGGSPRLVSAPRAATAARPYVSFPTAVDVTLPSRRNAVTIYTARGREITTCAGPDAVGKCPRPLEDGTVPCSGCLLALPRPIRGSFEWQIPAGYSSCLLGSYSVFRQTV
jgi:hypothetical protein